MNKEWMISRGTRKMDGAEEGSRSYEARRKLYYVCIATIIIY